jgi:hypothetical protein
MSKLDEYRKAIAKQGLLADATPPAVSHQALSETEAARLIAEYRVELAEKLLREDREARFKVRQMLRNKKDSPEDRPGPMTRLTDEQVYMLVELECLKGLPPKEAKTKVAAEHHYGLDSISTKHSRGKKQLGRAKDK